MEKKSSNKLSSFLYLILCVITGMIGYELHGSIFWAVVDFFLMPLVWVKWLLMKEVTWEVIKSTFDWFYK